MNGASNGNLFFGPAPWGPGEGSNGQISFNFNYKVVQRFLGAPQGVNFFFKHGHVAYQIDGDVEQNRLTECKKKKSP